ncbi:hypothetical protein [Tautonia rosea]|uniref:hypothetical protein n=1 Tax=Tautonia rosea TaxID=2728037 RepID=UPI001473CD3C|nr:hypothetical protein [Tautonia rosea]
MSEEDPREELDQIIELCAAGRLPQSAGQWAEDVYETAEDILETVDAMQSNGVDAPTSKQARALENIYDAARNWLER